MQPQMLFSLGRNCCYEHLFAVAVNLYHGIGIKVLGDHCTGDKSFELALDISLKRSCAVNGVISLLDNKLLSTVSNFKVKLLVGKTLLELC